MGGGARSDTAGAEAGVVMGLGGAWRFCGDATLEAMPGRLGHVASVASGAYELAEVSMRGAGREEPREGRLGLDSMLLERMEAVVASCFSRSFSQLQPGSTARLLMRSISARLRELVLLLLPSPAGTSANEVDGRSDLACAASSEMGAATVSSRERERDIAAELS